MITPHNVEEWLRQQRGDQHWDFWEGCSGTGRLSLHFKQAGSRVIFPIDFRYGWDIGFVPHQQLLEKVRDALKPKMWFWAPDCLPWGQSGNRIDPQLRALQRASQIPSLEWIFKQNKFQVTHGNIYVNENPVGSDIFRHSPLEKPGPRRFQDRPDRTPVPLRS